MIVWALGRRRLGGHSWLVSASLAVLVSIIKLLWNDVVYVYMGYVYSPIVLFVALITKRSRPDTVRENLLLSLESDRVHIPPPPPHMHLVHNLHPIAFWEGDCKFYAEILCRPKWHLFFEMFFPRISKFIVFKATKMLSNQKLSNHELFWLFLSSFSGIFDVVFKCTSKSSDKITFIFMDRWDFSLVFFIISLKF